MRGPGAAAAKLETVIIWMAEPATRDVMRVHRQLLSQRAPDPAVDTEAIMREMLRPFLR